MKLLLEGGRVVDPASGVDRECDLLIEDGKVAGLGSALEAEGAKRVDVSGRVVCPGFLDMHVHLREPGQEWKETMADGLRGPRRQAVAFTGRSPACRTPNRSTTRRSVTEFIVTAGGRRHGVRSGVYPIGCVTKGQKPAKQLAEMEDMMAAGARAPFRTTACPCATSSLMMRQGPRVLEVSSTFRSSTTARTRALVDGGVDARGRGVHGGWGCKRLAGDVAEDLDRAARHPARGVYGGALFTWRTSRPGRAVEFVRVAKESAACGSPAR